MRYVRLYACFLRFSFSRAMEFRVDFFFRIFMDVVWYAVNLAFFRVLYDHTASLGGWTLDQVLVFAGAIFVADALHMTVFSSNMWWFPIFVNRGDLDYYLVRPVSSLFFLSLRDFAANSFLNLVMAVGVLVWALARLPGPLPALDVVAFVVLLLVGACLHYVLNMVFLVPVFWLHASHGLREVFWSLDRFRDRPDGIFHGWVRRLLVSVLPFALIVSFPTKALLEGTTLPLLLHVAGVSAAAFAFLLWLWSRGLRAYASASS